MKPRFTYGPLRICHSLYLALVALQAGCTHARSTHFNGGMNAVLMRDLRVGVTAPVPLLRVKPSLAPRRALVGISGEVLVLCTVGEDGRVSNAVVKKCNYDELADLALDAVKRWTFAPGMRDGRPCATQVLIPIRFAYPDEEIIGSPTL